MIALFIKLNVQTFQPLIVILEGMILYIIMVMYTNLSTIVLSL